MNEKLPFLLIGHRGCAGVEPENTLLGVRRAIEMGCQMVEVDIHLVEGELVVMHDATVNRTTNGRGRLASMSLGELRDLDAGKGEQVPLLGEVLTLCRDRTKLNIEIKGEGCADRLIEVLNRHTNREVIVSSFDWKQLLELRKEDSELEIGVLLDRKTKVEEAFQFAKEIGAVSLNPSVAIVSSAFVERAHALGLLMCVFTVRTLSDLKCAVESRVDAAFVDDPEQIAQWCEASVWV